MLKGPVKLQKRLVGLRFFMVTVIIALIIVPLSVLTVRNYLDDSDKTKDKFATQAALIANSLRSATESQLKEADGVMKALSTDADILSGDGNRQRALLEKVAKMNPSFELFYVTNTKGMQTARSSGTNADRSDRDWFKTAIQGQYYFSGSYISKATNAPTVTIAMPLKDATGKLVGTLGGDLSLAYLQNLVKDVKLGQSGYVFMTDQKGIALAHPKFEEYVLKQLDVSKTHSVFEALKGNTDVSTWINSKGVEQFGAYTPVTTPVQGTRWTITVQLPKEELTATINQRVFQDILISLILALSAAIITFFVSIIFVNPVKKVMQTTKDVSSGDLTVLLTNTNGMKEFHQLNNSVNEMINKLKELLFTTQQNAQQVAEASAHLTQGSVSISEGANQIAATMQELSAGNENQTLQVETAATGVEKLRIEIQEINQKAGSVRSLTEALNDESKRSMDGVHQATRQMDSISEAARTSAEQINSLQNKSAQIEQMVSIITDIAQQTNLLALNAAIEAARAGEAGKGFAVVADEVRKLAEQSAGAADQITTVISEIRGETLLAVEAMNKGTAEAEKGTAVVRETLDSLERITTAIEDIVINTRDVASATERMYLSTEEVSGVVSNLAAISEESAAATEEVAASVTEQSATINELAKAAEELSALARQLDDTVKLFKLN